MNSRTEKLLEVLNDGNSERPICAFLKENPLLLTHSVQGHALANEVIAEFPYGNDHRADFIAFGPFSGGFSVHLFECEPPGAKIFTKDGKAAKRLNGAITQIGDWKRFLEKNRPCVLRDLSKYAKERELVWKTGLELIDNAGIPIYHPDSWVSWHYHILIGRRDTLNTKEMGIKASYYDVHDVEVMTYDRLVDTAKKLNQN